jgi:mRNA interferase YafQ
MLQIVHKSRFKKDYKKLKSSQKDLLKLKNVVSDLALGRSLQAKFQDHPLIGTFNDHRECHIAPDWLLIYKVTETELILVRTGSHSELFG